MSVVGAGKASSILMLAAGASQMGVTGMEMSSVRGFFFLLLFLNEGLNFCAVQRQPRH